MLEANGWLHPTVDDLKGWPTGTYGIDSVSGVNWIAIGDENDDLLQFRQPPPINKYDATLRGIEVAIQHFFEGTPYGVQANVTVLDSGDEADPYDTGEQSALPDLVTVLTSQSSMKIANTLQDFLITTEMKVTPVKINLTLYSSKQEVS